jgi:dTDP-4-amino-4,6-dideoxygalactose transaminase
MEAKGSLMANLSANQAATAPTAVPLIDIQRQYRELQTEIAAAIARVCESGKFVLGPDCETLEKGVARYSGAPHGIACASGSDALLLALMACDIQPGDEVIVPSYTFFATASAVSRLGAKPVFVDIDPTHFLLDPQLVEAAITPATKAIIPVHLFGQCADMASINSIAKHHDLKVIEDAAQAIGAEFDGHRAGSIGDIGCFSFYPTKNLGGFGDGGMLTTNSDNLAASLRLIRVHGMQPRYYHHVMGINSRLDTLQAAILNVKLPRLDLWTAQRQTHARRYTGMFAARGLDRILSLPSARSNCRHVWNQFIVRIPEGRRDALRQHLTERKIGTEIYYPVPLHEQECFAYLDCPRGSLPETERAAQETLALPIFPEMAEDEQVRVVDAIADFYALNKPAQPAAGVTLAGPKFLKHPIARERADRSAAS